MTQIIDKDGAPITDPHVGRDWRPDATWFNEIYLTYRDDLVRYAARRDAVDAEGVADLALLDLARAHDRMRSIKPPVLRAYLYKAIRSHIARERTKIRPQFLEELDPLDDRDSFEERVLDSLDIDALLTDLPPSQQAVLRLRFFEQFTTEETGDVLGITASTVRTHQHRGIGNLRRMLFAALVVAIAVGGLVALRRDESQSLDNAPARPTIEPDRNDERRTIVTTAPDGDQGSQAVATQASWLDYSVPGTVGGEITEANIEFTVSSLDSPEGSRVFPSLQLDFGPGYEIPGLTDTGRIGLLRIGDDVKSNWVGSFREFTDPDHRYSPFLDERLQVIVEDQAGPRVLYNPDPGVDLDVGHTGDETYSQINQRDQQFFNWEVGRTYKLSVYRGGQIDGFWSWHGWIDDLTDGQSYYIGALYTTRPSLSGFSTSVETDGPVDSLSYDVVFEYPVVIANGQTFRPMPISASASAAPNATIYAPDEGSLASTEATVHHMYNVPIPNDGFTLADGE